MANELNAEMLKVALDSIDDFATRELPDALLIELDEKDEFPEEIVRRMSSGEGLGIQLLFVPFEYGGMGGGALDVYRICERMAAIDLGLATSELATFLGSDPIRVSRRSDGSYSVDGGRHRVELARRLGIRSLPVRIIG